MRLASITLLSALFVSPVAMADHNSVWGEGWANMPNDIHNTRIDTISDDSDAFTDFVRYGNGADSVNRFLDDDSATLVSDMGAGGSDMARSTDVAMGGSDMARGGSRR